MTTLEIKGVHASAAGVEILHGIDLAVSSGEVHVLMGPNGSGKSTLSHVIMGRPGYEVTAGEITLDGVDVLQLAPWERAQAGLFIALQYPTEVPGVRLHDVISEAFSAAGRDTADIASTIEEEAARIDFGAEFLTRSLNVDLSGGEKKRNETLQLGVIKPRIAILDELDSGLDVDALHICAHRIEQMTNEYDLGVLAITHYSRLLRELHADRIYVLIKGKIADSGGPELAAELEADGYARFLPEDPLLSP